MKVNSKQISKKELQKQRWIEWLFPQNFISLLYYVTQIFESTWGRFLFEKTWNSYYLCWLTRITLLPSVILALKFLLYQITVKILFCWPLWFSVIRSWIVVRRKCGFKFVSVTFLVGDLKKVNFNALLHSLLTLETNIPYCTVKVIQLCLSLCNPVNCSPPRLLCGDSPGKNSGVGYHAILQEIFPPQGLNPSLLRCRQILYQLSHQGSPETNYCSFYINVVMIK